MSSLNDIAVFVEVVKHGSFTAAAESLNMSRPMVSKNLTRLEESLGTRLLHRTTRKLSLTEAGQRYFEKCSAGLNTLHEADEEVQLMQAIPRGTLKLNTPYVFWYFACRPLLAEFNLRFPEVQVEMNLDDRMLNVIEDGYDISIRIADLPDSSMIARRLCACNHAIVASPTYLKKNGTPKSPEDLKQHHILSYRYQVSRHEWHFLNPQGEHRKVLLQSQTQINNSLAIREAVIQGLGIARMPTFIVGPDIQAGKLVVLLNTLDILQLSVFLVYPQRKLLSPKVRAFIDFISEKYSESPQWDKLI